MVPGGLRMGSPALTSRGFVESDFHKVAEFVDRGVDIAVGLKQKLGEWCWACLHVSVIYVAGVWRGMPAC